MLKNLKNNKKKGFTLVELIVVLVILAILAALLIPALTGYIDKAKEKQVIAETRQAVMAAQTLVDEAYGKQASGTAVTVGDGKMVTYTEIAKLAEVTGDVSNIELYATNDTNGKGNKIKKLQYHIGNKWCVYDETSNNGTDGHYNVTNTAPTTVGP